MDISIEKELLTFNIDRVLKKEMYFNIFVSISNNEKENNMKYGMWFSNT